MTLPEKPLAGSTVTLTLVLPPEAKRQRYVQIVAVPLDGKAVAQPLLQELQQERAPAFAVASNIPADWPALPAFEPVRRPPTVGDSQLSPPTVVPPDGRVTVAVTMPPQGEKAALHVLVWDDATIGEKLHEVALQPAATAPVPRAESTEMPPPLAWRFSCLAPVHKDQSVPLNPQSDKAPGKASAVLLSPLPLPDVGQLLSQLWDADTNRSDVLARGLLALQSYRALLEVLGVKPAQFVAWRSRIIALLASRQRGDGGIALYAEAPHSDLTASAFALLAWHSVPDDPLVLERQNALQDHIARRLDVAWGAETELYARSDAFYALGILGKIDPAALRYFVEKYGNAIRHAVFEAELAAALASIGDKLQSQQFGLRAVAQLPAMRVEQPQNALQVLQILVHHDLVTPQEAVALLPDNAALPPPQLTLAAVTGAQLWSDLTSRLPEWQAQLEAEQLTLRGLVGKPLNAKRVSRLLVKSEQPLYACVTTAGAETAKLKALQPAASAHTSIKRAIFTLHGQPLRQPHLTAEQDYVVVISAPEVTAGPAEFLVPLPPELRLRAVVPGSPVVGHLSWLRDTDQVQAHRVTPDGLVLALSRPTAGSLKLALLVQARRPGAVLWPGVQMAQFNATQRGADEQLTIE